MSRRDERKLGEILADRGVVEQEKLNDLLSGTGRVASQLCDFGVEETDLVDALVTQLGHPGIVLSMSTIAASAASFIPNVIAAKYQLIPLGMADDVLRLAVRDPHADSVLDQIRFATGLRIETYLALEGELRRAIDLLYRAYTDKQGLVYFGRDEAPEAPHLEIIRLSLPPDEMLPEDESLFDEPAATSQPPAPAEPTPEVATSTSTPLVLVVDDDQSIRQMLTTVMEHEGYQVLQADSGTAALDCLRAHRPDVVLLDAMLPEVHGFEICRTIKQSPAFSSTHVVMISAVYRGWELSRDVQEVHGADAFIEKPFEIAYVRKLVADLVGGPTPARALFDAQRQQIEALKAHAQAAYRGGDDNSALAAVERWSSLDPFDPMPYLVAGNIHHKNQNPTAALVAYERAATFGRENFAAVKNLALVYEQLGFLRRARETWTAAHALAQDDPTRMEIAQRLRERFGVVDIPAP